MDLNKLGEVVQTYGEAIIQQMRDELAANGSIATAELLDSISYSYQVNAEQILVQFLSADYGMYVEKGRAAGSFPPISKIQQWCEVKGLPDKAAFPIAKNIFKFGIKPRPFIFSAYESKKQEFIIALMQVYGQQVKIDIKQELDQLPKQVNI